MSDRDASGCGRAAERPAHRGRRPRLQRPRLLRRRDRDAEPRRARRRRRPPDAVPHHRPLLPVAGGPADRPVPAPRRARPHDAGHRPTRLPRLARRGRPDNRRRPRRLPVVRDRQVAPRHARPNRAWLRGVVRVAREREVVLGRVVPGPHRRRHAARHRRAAASGARRTRPTAIRHRPARRRRARRLGRCPRDAGDAVVPVSGVQRAALPSARPARGHRPLCRSLRRRLGQVARGAAVADGRAGARAERHRTAAAVAVLELRPDRDRPQPGLGDAAVRAPHRLGPADGDLRRDDRPNGPADRPRPGFARPARRARRHARGVPVRQRFVRRVEPDRVRHRVEQPEHPAYRRRTRRDGPDGVVPQRGVGLGERGKHALAAVQALLPSGRGAFAMPGALARCDGRRRRLARRDADAFDRHPADTSRCGRCG